MAIYNAIMAFTGWMWTLPMLIVLIGGGLVITVACDFVQIKHFGHMLKTTFGDAAHHKDESGISSWSAMVLHWPTRSEQETSLVRTAQLHWVDRELSLGCG